MGFKWHLAAPKKIHRNLQEWSFWENESKDSTQETKKVCQWWHGMTSQSLWEVNHALSKSWMLLGFLMHVMFDFLFAEECMFHHFSRVFTCFLASQVIASCQQPQSVVKVLVWFLCPSFLFSVFLKSYNLSPKMSPFMLEKRAKLNVVCLYSLCWIKIPGDHHFLATPRKLYRPGLGFIVYIKDMFATCLTKMKPAILEAWKTFHNKDHCISLPVPTKT